MGGRGVRVAVLVCFSLAGGVVLRPSYTDEVARSAPNIINS